MGSKKVFGPIELIKDSHPKMVRFVIIQCFLTSVIVLLSLGGISDATKDQRWTEQEKQTAFQQLLSGAGRLRLEASSSDGAIVVQSSAAELLANDEESKRHDRRQAIDVSGKENHKKKKKEEKQANPKGQRQHHHGYEIHCIV